LVKVGGGSLAGRQFAIHAGIVVILVAAGFVGAYAYSSNTNQEDAEQRGARGGKQHRR